MNLARNSQLSAQDTLRWGDSESVMFTTPVGAGPPIIAVTSTQLNAAHWRWPLTWTMLIIINPQLAASEAGTFKVAIKVTVGVGQSITTFEYDYTFAPSSGVYTPVVDQKFIPAQDIQVTATVSGVSTLSATTEGFLIGCYVAPMTEPHAMTALLEAAAPNTGEREGGWMPAGFNPEALGYKR